ncbi:MAG: carboxypeptidase regulatory-like domain-containing protein [Bacteroidales bacterium]
MRAVTCHAALVALLALTVSACEERPARPTAPTLSGTPSSLEIRGTTRYYRPGDTGQLTAVAVYPNGMRTDAASLEPVIFSVSAGSSVVAIAANGFVRAIGYGRATVQLIWKGQVATTQVVVLPEGTFLLYGQVTQGTQQVPIPQAQVDFVMPGQSFSTQTDGTGAYSLPALGTGTLRVEAANFVSQSLPVSLNADTQVDVVLTRSNDAFGGTYTLTFTASPSCSLPLNLATRRYIATVTDAPTDLVVLLSGAKFSLGGPWEVPGFTGTRSGNEARFTIANDWWSGYSFAEDLGNNQVLFFDGQATGSIDASGQLKTIFNGTVTWSTASSYTPCKATDHRFDFIR